MSEDYFQTLKWNLLKLENRIYGDYQCVTYKVFIYNAATPAVSELQGLEYVASQMTK